MTKGEVFDLLDEIVDILESHLAGRPEFAEFVRRARQLTDAFKEKVADYQPGDSMSQFESEIKELANRFALPG